MKYSILFIIWVIFGFGTSCKNNGTTNTNPSPVEPVNSQVPYIIIDTNESEIKIAEFGNAPINGDTIIYQWSELSAYQGYDKNYFGTNYRNINVRNEDAKDLSHGYLASISFIDELVGRLVNTLKKHDLEKNTIIVFVLLLIKL